MMHVTPPPRHLWPVMRRMPHAMFGEVPRQVGLLEYEYIKINPPLYLVNISHLVVSST